MQLLGKCLASRSQASLVHNFSQYVTLGVMKSLRLILGVVLIIVLGGIYVWKTQPQLLSSFNFPEFPNKEVSNLSQRITENLQPALQESEPIVSSLTIKGEEVASRASAVLGATVGISEPSNQPVTLIEGTLEYTRYWYCKQVVDRYELQYQTK